MGDFATSSEDEEEYQPLFELTNVNRNKNIKERKTSRFFKCCWYQNSFKRNRKLFYLGDRSKYKRVRGSARFVYDLNVTNEILNDEAHAKYILSNKEINFSAYSCFEIWNILKEIWKNDFAMPYSYLMLITCMKNWKI
ncbi:hypothetical protein U3516DRAFT_736030 [Neocallimastix sp. 'constans']